MIRVLMAVLERLNMDKLTQARATHNQLWIDLEQVFRRLSGVREPEILLSVTKKIYRAVVDRDRAEMKRFATNMQRNGSCPKCGIALYGHSNKPEVMPCNVKLCPFEAQSEPLDIRKLLRVVD